MTNADSQPPIEAAAPAEDTPQPAKSPRQRAALYVDGFNTYHALDDLKQPFLKWLNLAEVARHLVAGRPEEVVRIVFCTAIRTDDTARMTRHRYYVRALEGAGVTVLRGYFAGEKRDCRRCGNNWDHPTEKEGDTSLAITIIDDAHRDIFDVAYLLTAEPGAVHGLMRAFNRVVAERGNFPQVAAIGVWLHTMRAFGTYGDRELAEGGRAMWNQLRRGFPLVPTVMQQLPPKAQQNLMLDDYDVVPAPCAIDRGRKLTA